MDPSLRHILNSSTIEWIFVGGKGGVGKTTTSCSLATALATTPRADGTYRKVLIVSTDPAHNISDAFNQSIGDTPSKIELQESAGEVNLFGMEIDPQHVMNRPEGIFDKLDANAGRNVNMKQVRKLLQIAAKALPGVDEIAVFAELLGGIQSLHFFDVIVFDTAPTGHTLRLLALPDTLQQLVDSVMNMDGALQMMEAASHFFKDENNDTAGLDDSVWTKERIAALLGDWKSQVQRVQANFTDPSKTMFVCVCIAEFLSVYETERLLQELMKYNINCDSIVINQLIKKPSKDDNNCKMCNARVKMQSKYMDQVHSLYEDDFHLVEMPLLSDEVRGWKSLRRFSQFYLNRTTRMFTALSS
ncbi:arsenite-transporting ATPase [Angomonas deanei]|nr:arsenite-transporting ATPase [Angomonas deanei]|eukprot:EPY35430.1 arsenite-transporting ATPase [Angomonas deanei]